MSLGKALLSSLTSPYWLKFNFSKRAANLLIVKG